MAPDSLSEQSEVTVWKAQSVIWHGGAWKVAYADFTTAMMAFFMLLWLLNVSDKETLEGLADYFSPTSATISSASGAGKPLAGAALSAEGALTSGSTALEIPAPPPTSPQDATEISRDAEDANATAEQQLQSRINDDAALEQLTQQLRITLQESPDLRQNQDQLVVEQTQEGVKVQLIDKDRRPLFRPGTAELYDFAENLLQSIGEAIGRLPNQIEITGHTDSGPTGQGAAYTNWELSADRANTARRVLRVSGVSEDRFATVSGKSDTDPIYPDAPFRAENRRVSILVVRDAPVVPSRR